MRLLILYTIAEEYNDSIKNENNVNGNNIIDIICGKEYNKTK